MKKEKKKEKKNKKKKKTSRPFFIHCLANFFLSLSPFFHIINCQTAKKKFKEGDRRRICNNHFQVQLFLKPQFLIPTEWNSLPFTVSIIEHFSADIYLNSTFILYTIAVAHIKFCETTSLFIYFSLYYDAHFLCSSPSPPSPRPRPPRSNRNAHFV